MSHSRPSSKRSETQRRITNVIDHTNIDDFFNQPSPHELTATSERRVQEIIEDLKRRTAEEIKNWSWESPVDEKFEAAEFLGHGTEKTKIISDRDMVRSPVSLLPSLSSPSSATESDCPAALPIESKNESCSKSDRPARVEASSSPPQNELLRAPNRSHNPNRTTAKVHNSRNLGHTSSVPLVVKRGAKIPSPIPIIARDFAYEYPKTPFEDPRTPPFPPPVTPATPSKTLQQITQAEQIMKYMNLPRAGQSSTSHEQARIPTSEGSVIHGTDTSLSPSPPAPVAPLRIKRKPLPADSPLLVPLGGHPAFAMIAPERNGPWL